MHGEFRLNSGFYWESWFLDLTKAWIKLKEFHVSLLFTYLALFGLKQHLDNSYYFLEANQNVIRVEVEFYDLDDWQTFTDKMRGFDS